MEGLESSTAFEEVQFFDQASLGHRSNALTLDMSSGRMASILRAKAPGGFKIGLQHDCHEALTYILSSAHEEETKLLEKLRHQSKYDADHNTMEHHGVVARNFGIEEHVGLTVSTRYYMVHDVYVWFIAFVFSNIGQCSKCNDLRSKVDLAFIVSLPLNSSSAAQDISVKGIFSASANAEAVDATCSKCGCLTAVSRTTYVPIGANVIIQLKRWTANAESKVRQESWPCLILLNNGAQDSKHVALSPTLDICTSPPSAPTPNTTKFFLVGNVMHTGRTLNSGHYYADLRCNHRWIRVNDTSVQHIDWNHFQLQSPSWSGMAYVQIYSCFAIAPHAAKVSTHPSANATLEVGQVLPAHFAPTARVFVRDIARSGTVDKVLLNLDGLLRGYRIIYDPVDASLDQSGNHPWQSVFRMIKSPEHWPADALGLNACVKVTACFNIHKRGMTGVGRICALCVDMTNYVHYYAISFQNEDVVSYVHEANAKMVAPGTSSALPKASTAAPAPAPAAAPTTPQKRPFPAATPSASVSASALKAPAAKRPDVSSADIHSRLRSSTLPEHATFKFLSSRPAPYDATAAELESVADFSSFATPATPTGCITRQRAASLATTQPQPHPATSRSRLDLRQNLSDLFNEATRNRGEAALAVPARPTAGQSAVECTPLSDSDAQLDIGALIMLRDVAQLGTCLRIPLMPVANHKCYTPTVGISGGVKFPIFEFEQAAFIIDDFGTNFTGVYPDHVQKVLDAFKLNETNRCFFLALGIGTSIDPFLLQCLFRRHARYVIQNKTVLLNSTGGYDDETNELQGSIDSELESLANVMEPGSSIDCSVLRYLWPIEFDIFRIVVLCTRPDNAGVARCNVVVYNSSSTDDVLIQASQDVDRKQTIFLKLENGHYTLLTLVHGSVDVSDAHISQWFAHDVNEGLRCPSITTMNFQEKVFPEAYVASAVDGTVPSADEVDAIWLQLTAHHGIEFGRKGEWLKGIPRGVATTDENQQGSIDVVSFNNVRNALLNALEAKDNSTDSTTSSSRLRRSCSAMPASAHASPSRIHAAVLRASVPCVFLDLGSESGRALVRMLHDDRITHAAGVEHQIPWFQLSVTLFQEIRQAFVDARLRMPAITLFRSCMLKTKPELAYIYAITNIAYMNNEVFDKAKVAQPLLVHLKKTDPAKRNLSANAAYALSKSFQNRTCIAVFKPDHFNASFNYKDVFAVKVNPTWAGWIDYSMFIKSLPQQVVIAPRIRLLCASYAEVRNFQEVVRSWSNALAPAYAIIQGNKYYESQTHQAEKGRNRPRQTRMHKGNTQYDVSSDSGSEDGLDTRLLERVLPSQIFNSVPVRPEDTFDIVNIQSMATLQPRKLLCQKVIQEYMSLLAQHFNTTSFCPSLMDGIAWNELRSPSKHIVEKEREKFCRQYFPGTLKSPEKPIVFAMNPFGNHWIALKIHMTKKYIATACSLNNEMNELAQGVLKMISVHHKPASTFQHISVKVPHQKNSVDCGPLCCLFMLFFAHNDITRSTTLDYDSEFTAVAMRLRIAADIGNKKLTPLVAQ